MIVHVVSETHQVMQSGNWWLSWTFIAVTPADPHIIIVVVIATGDDVIVT